MAEVTAPTFDGRKSGGIAALVALVGVGVLALGLVVDPGRTWLSYLWAFTFAFTIAVGGLILLMIAYVTNARWMSVIRRATEAVTLPLPALVVLFVPILFGLSWLYPWHTHPADLGDHELHILEHRAAYLNTPGLIARATVYFALLVIASLLLRRWSLKRERGAELVDVADSVAALRRERRFAAGMLPFVGFAFTFAMIDWVMALEAAWYSSMFGVYVFAGGFLSAIALVTIYTMRVWRRSNTGGVVTRNHFHALGRLLFAFTVFWAYAAYFQAMLIRIANKPEEVTFYLERIEGTWRVFVWILIVGHFVLPFFLLLPRHIKFRPVALAVIAGWLVVMHLVDMYWLVIPAHVDGTMVLHWVDLGALAAVIGTCVAVAAWRQHGVPLVAMRDPFLAQGALYKSPL